MRFLILLWGLSVQLSCSFADTAHFLSDSYIQEINSKQDLWQAGRNFPADTPLSKIKMRMGTFTEDRHTKPRTVKTFDPQWPETKRVPKRFDARKRWRRQCPRIAEVLDQGECGSDWAISAASAMTDRYCIMTKGKHQIRLSASHVLSCCTDCGLGCQGGRESDAWSFFLMNGIPSGGNFNTTEGCQPYMVQSPCNHGNNEPYKKCVKNHPTPSCYKYCYNSQYKTEYLKDFRYVKDVYYPEQDTMKDIMTHGPVTTHFTVYEDFPSYKSGVYEPTTDKTLGELSVKIIGWGEENSVPYWLVMNSWNEYWGDHGLIKMKRNSDMLDLDVWAMAGLPVDIEKGE